MWGNAKLTAEQEAGKQQVIAACKRSGSMENVEGDGWDAYAYPQAGNQIAWGVNGPPDGFNIARGTVPK